VHVGRGDEDDEDDDEEAAAAKSTHRAHERELKSLQAALADTQPIGRCDGCFCVLV
jgi:hypothetical protein